jgi:hypothetical protein
MNPTTKLRWRLYLSMLLGILYAAKGVWELADPSYKASWVFPSIVAAALFVHAGCAYGELKKLPPITPEI